MTFLLANMSRGIMSPILADLQFEFGVRIVQLALANSAFGLARLVLGLVLGQIAESSFSRSLMLYNGYSGFFTRPGALILLVLCVVILAYPYVTPWLERRRERGKGAAA